MGKELTKTPGGHESPFERIKRTNDANNEYWEWRDPGNQSYAAIALCLLPHHSKRRPKESNKRANFKAGMIRVVEVLNYRCLRYIRMELGGFHVLVGPNASGKTTFLDVISFLSDIVSKNPFAAVQERSLNYADLIWLGLKEGTQFEIAIEMDISKENDDIYRGRCRYEVSLGKLPGTEEFGIISETLLFNQSVDLEGENVQRVHFPDPKSLPQTIMYGAGKKGWKTIIRKQLSGNSNFYVKTNGSTYFFKLGPKESALGRLPDDSEEFPIATCFKKKLSEKTQKLMLNSELMRRPSPPGMSLHFRSDGSNLPWIIDHLEKESPQRFKDWVGHLQTALEDIADIKTVLREEDKHRYLVLIYKNGFRAPSWTVSDGTLRMLALTILAYLPGVEGTILIEEPENGIHPQAIETVIQSLSSVYDAQVLIATHSPVILGVTDINNLICFSKTQDGIVDMVSGKNHPRLRNWKKEVSLDVLFASGVLG
jgi:predicted ATPase